MEGRAGGGEGVWVGRRRGGGRVERREGGRVGRTRKDGGDGGERGIGWEGGSWKGRTMMKLLHMCIYAYVPLFLPLGPHPCEMIGCHC